MLESFQPKLQGCFSRSVQCSLHSVIQLLFPPNVVHENNRLVEKALKDTFSCFDSFFKPGNIGLIVWSCRPERHEFLIPSLTRCEAWLE